MTYFYEVTDKISQMSCVYDIYFICIIIFTQFTCKYNIKANLHGSFHHQFPLFSVEQGISGQWHRTKTYKDHFYCDDTCKLHIAMYMYIHVVHVCK